MHDLVGLGLHRKENLAQGASWETLSWFAALIAMANHLNKFGFIAWFSDKVRHRRAFVHCPPGASAPVMVFVVWVIFLLQS